MSYIFPFLLSFVISILSAPYTISFLKKIQRNGQPIRKNGPKTHLQTKQGTPTMGGIIILFSTIFSSLFFLDIGTKNFVVILFVVLSYALLGGLDDYKKLIKNNSKGISAKGKLIIQCLIATVIVYLLDDHSANFTQLALPFGYEINLGLFYYPFAVMVIISYSNAVNVTDGLDGLATVPVILAAICLSIISYYYSHSYEVFIVCLTLIGACLGFLFFNANPAKIFMGDVGSISIGALLGTMSIIIKYEIIFAIISGLFVIEAFSSVMQIYYFKITKGKRLFLMAPIHHHFEQLGWTENTIVVRFWIFAALCSAIGMALI